MPGKVKATLESRFWARVNKTDDCWLWTGTTTNGYGKIHVTVPGGVRGPDGRAPRTNRLVHRVSWEFAHGPIPAGFEVMHNCPGGDNPRCVNPAHLKLGKHADNMLDAAQKAQMPRGESKPMAKLTDDNVKSIRQRYAAGGITQQALADEFHVAISQINWVVTGKAWRHVQ